MVVGGLVTAAAAGDVGVAGAVDVGAAAAAVVVGDGDAGIELDFEFDVVAPVFGIGGREVVGGLQAAEGGLGEETDDNVVVVIEHAGREAADTAAAAAGVVVVVAGVVVGMNAFERYTVGAGIDEEAEDYVGAASEKRL